jgi:RNA polymerase sigma-32 factor
MAKKKVSLKKSKSSKATRFRKVEAEIHEPALEGDEESEELSIPDLIPELIADGGDSEEFANDRDSDSERVGDAAVVIPEVVSADPVATYLAELRKYPILTREQEHELAIRYREQADAKAAETLVTSNLRFVVKIAAEYSKFGARLIDLIQEGNVGLMHAVKEFNPYQGTKLITYAVWWIRGYIQEYLMRQYSMVRIGTTQNQRKLFYRLQKERELLEQIGKTHDYAMLGSRLGVSAEEVETMTKRLSGRDVSLSQPVDSDSNATLLDFEASEDQAVDEQLGHAEELQILAQNIQKIRHELNEKETYILEKRLLSDEPLTLQEIGDHFGITREAIRQIEARLMNRIKTQFGNQ